MQGEPNERAREAKDDILSLATRLEGCPLEFDTSVEAQQKAITFAKDIRSRCADLIYDLTGVEVDRC